MVIPSPPENEGNTVKGSRPRHPPPPPSALNCSNAVPPAPVPSHPPPPAVVAPIPQAPPNPVVQLPQPPAHNNNFYHNNLLSAYNSSRTSYQHNNSNNNYNNTSRPHQNDAATNDINCDTCNKSFYNVGAYRRHVDESHIFCAEEGCSYHGPPDKVDVHMAFKHAKDANGVTVVDTAEDIQLWRNSRKRNFPTCDNVALKETTAKKKQKIGALDDVKAIDTRGLSPTEVLIRKRQTTAHGQLGQKVPTSSLVPYLRRAHHRLNDALSEAVEVQADPKSPKLRRKQAELIKTLNSDGMKTGGWMISNTNLLHTPFPICHFIDKGRVCPHGKECHLSHDTAAYNRYKYQRKCAQTDFPRRPPLSYLLLTDEIMKSESLLLQAFRFLVKTKFFEEEGLETSIESRIQTNEENKLLLSHSSPSEGGSNQPAPAPPPPPPTEDVFTNDIEEESLESGEVEEEADDA